MGFFVNFVADDDTLVERVRRFLGRRKDLSVVFSAEFSERADVNVIPASMLKDISNPNRTRLPVLAYGSHIFLRDAFLAGCADFCKDPWSLEELGLRLDNLLSAIRKNYDFPWGRLGFEGNDVALNGENIRLTYQEMRVLRMLVEQRGNVVPREALFYAIWGNPGSVTSRVVDVHVASIRKKLNTLISGESGEKIISSVRNVGYIIA